MKERHFVMWRRVDLPGGGHELAELRSAQDEHRLMGTVLFAFEGTPCRFDYTVVCDDAWRTREVTVHGASGPVAKSLTLTSDGAGRWNVDGRHAHRLDGCLDIDLSFTPSTNTLPIRRLRLEVGQSAPVVAAWVKFPSLTVEPLDQVYRRTGDRSYAYESRGGSFHAALTVDALGFVTEYPGLWIAEGARPIAVGV